VGWIGLAQDRDKLKALVNAVMNLRFPQNAGKLSSALTGVLSSSTQPRGVRQWDCGTVSLIVPLCPMFIFTYSSVSSGDHSGLRRKQKGQ
jgi:hypothetical protein